MRLPLALCVLPLLALAGCSDAPAVAPADAPLAPGELGGMVLDPAIVPLPGITITLVPGNGTAGASGTPPSTVTAADGTWTLGPLTPGVVALDVTGAGYVPVRVAATVAAGVRTEVPITLQRAATDTSYHRTATFQGRVDVSAGAATVVAEEVGRDAGLTGCTCVFDVAADGPFRSMILEATWQDSIDDPTEPTEYVWRVTVNGTTAQGQGANPLYKELGSLDFPEQGFDLRAHREFQVAVYPDASWPAVSQSYDVYVTFWYGESAPDGWSFVASGAEGA